MSTDSSRGFYETERVTLESGTKTATTDGAKKDVQGNVGGLFFLNVTAASGTSPSLTVKLQTSDDGGTTWYDYPSGAFAAATGVTTQVLLLTGKLGDTMRAVSTITGTTPSFTYTVKAVL